METVTAPRAARRPAFIRMTELQSMSNNHILFHCACGHSAKMSVSLFIEKYGKDARVSGVVKKARYTRCRTKGNADSRIIWVGG